jgi:hypothetical protein
VDPKWQRIVSKQEASDCTREKNSDEESLHRWESNLNPGTYQLAILSHANDEDMGIYFDPYLSQTPAKECNQVCNYSS